MIKVTRNVDSHPGEVSSIAGYFAIKTESFLDMYPNDPVTN